MPGPDIDIEKPNLIGGLDKLVTNFAISVIAVIPSFWICVVMPWRIRRILDRDDPDGRMGLLLAPGAFFPLALMVSFVLAALLSTPETVSYNGAYIGPDLAVSVQTAASEGDIWKIVATIMPIYGIAVIIGLLGAALKPWSRQDWTLRVSLRAAFYVIAVLVSWLMLSTAIIDLVRLAVGSSEIASMLYKIIALPTVVAVVRIYYCFFRNGGTVSWVRSGVLTLAMFGMIITPMVILDFLLSL